LDETVCKMVVT